jgi:hypothetical protein
MIIVWVLNKQKEEEEKKNALIVSYQIKSTP